jgi:hypothetical protein
VTSASEWLSCWFCRIVLVVVDICNSKTNSFFYSLSSISLQLQHTTRVTATEPVVLPSQEVPVNSTPQQPATQPVSQQPQPKLASLANAFIPPPGCVVANGVPTPPPTPPTSIATSCYLPNKTQSFPGTESTNTTVQSPPAPAISPPASPKPALMTSSSDSVVLDVHNDDDEPVQYGSATTHASDSTSTAPAAAVAMTPTALPNQPTPQSQVQVSRSIYAKHEIVYFVEVYHGR